MPSLFSTTNSFLTSSFQIIQQHIFFFFPILIVIAIFIYIVKLPSVSVSLCLSLTKGGRGTEGVPSFIQQLLFFPSFMKIILLSSQGSWSPESSDLHLANTQHLRRRRIKCVTYRKYHILGFTFTFNWNCRPPPEPTSSWRLLRPSLTSFFCKYTSGLKRDSFLKTQWVPSN